jgi:hypothetical protein
MQNWTGTYELQAVEAPRISTQSAHAGGTIVSPTHRLPVKVILLVIWDTFVLYYNILTPDLYEYYMPLNLMSDCQEKQKEVIINARGSRGLKNKAKAKTALRDILKRPRLQCALHVLGTSHSAFTLFWQKTVFGEAEPHLVSYHLLKAAMFLQKIDRT